MSDDNYAEDLRQLKSLKISYELAARDFEKANDYLNQIDPAYKNIKITYEAMEKTYESAVDSQKNLRDIKDEAEDLYIKKFYSNDIFLNKYSRWDRWEEWD